MAWTRPPPLAPIALAASSSASRPRATIATSAPEAANRVAIASPIPLLAPVTTAVRPARLISIDFPPPPPGYSPVSLRSKAARVHYRRFAGWVTTMEFTALFLAITVVMLVAWKGTRTLALALFGAVLLASVATYLHHATDVLKLSF